MTVIAPEHITIQPNSLYVGTPVMLLASENPDEQRISLLRLRFGLSDRCSYSAFYPTAKPSQTC